MLARRLLEAGTLSLEPYTDNDIAEANKILTMFGYSAKAITEPASHLHPERRQIVLIQQRKHPMSMDISPEATSLSSEAKKLLTTGVSIEIRTLIDQIFTALPSALVPITEINKDAVCELVKSQFLTASFTGIETSEFAGHPQLKYLGIPHCFPALKFLLEMCDCMPRDQFAECVCTYCNTIVGFGVVCACRTCAHFDCISQLLSYGTQVACLKCGKEWERSYIKYIEQFVIAKTNS